jgi:hypothetical protein
MASDSVTINLGLGVDQLSPQTNLAYNQQTKQSAARRAVNVDIHDSGTIRRREGYSQVIAGDSVHSLGGNERITVFVDNGTLYQLNSDETKTALRSGLSPNRLLSYDTINDDLYYTNGEVIERIVDGAVTPVGVETPVGQPTLSALSYGGLEEGQYQVAITFVTGYGEESGTGPSAVVSVGLNGGIGLTSIPQPSSGNVEYIRVYVSPPNGDMLYFAMPLPVGTTTTTYGYMPLGRALRSQFCEPTPPGHILRYYHGRLYVASNNLIFYSEPQSYGRCKISRNFIGLASRITMMEPVESGFYISTDTEVFFLPGDDPSTGYRLQRASDTPAIEGSSMVVKPEVLGIDGISGSTQVALWFTSAGWVVGLPDGNIRFLTRDRLALPEYSQATSLLRMVNGMSQLVTVPRGNGEVASAFASDSMEAEIVRNGVIVS